MDWSASHPAVKGMDTEWKQAHPAVKRAEMRLKMAGLAAKGNGLPVKWTETELKTTRMRLRGLDIAAKGMETGLKESETEMKGLSTERKNVRPHPNSLSQERGKRATEVKKGPPNTPRNAKGNFNGLRRKSSVLSEWTASRLTGLWCVSRLSRAELRIEHLTLDPSSHRMRRGLGETEKVCPEIDRMNARPHPGPLPQERESLGGDQPTNFFAMTVALWPPKPKELFTMALTFISRALCGT